MTQAEKRPNVNILFRLGGLQDWLTERAREGESLGLVAKRSLERYASLLQEELERVPLTDVELGHMCFSFWGWVHPDESDFWDTPRSFRYLPFEAEDAFKRELQAAEASGLEARLTSDGDVVDWKGIMESAIAKLKATTQGQRVAIVDFIERSRPVLALYGEAQDEEAARWIHEKRFGGRQHLKGILGSAHAEVESSDEARGSS